MVSRSVVLGGASVLLALLIFTSGPGIPTSSKSVRFYDPKDMQRMLSDQERLQERLDKLISALHISPPPVAARSSLPPSQAQQRTKHPMVEAPTAPSDSGSSGGSSSGGGSGALLACNGGCGGGTCNQDLGRCDCPPFKKGPRL